MKITIQSFGLLSLLLFGLMGCHDFGPLGDYVTSRYTLRGTVQRNDPRYSSILIDTDDHRQVAFYHNDKTRIRYRERDYPVQSIQPGDVVEVWTRDREQLSPTADVVVVVRKGQN